MATLTLNVIGRSNVKPISVSLPSSASTEELYKQVAAKTRLDINRLRISTQEKKQKINLSAKLTLEQAGLNTEDNLTWKDLGPQVSWRMVYILEYLGPLIIHPIFYFLGHELVYHLLPGSYGSVARFKHSKMQVLSFMMVMAHFLKRELESLYLHRFSRATMPLSFLPRNCAYYWGLPGLLLSIPLYGPWYGASVIKRGTLRGSDEFLYPCVGTWLFAEFSNLACHIILSSLRPRTDLGMRQIPDGYAFNKIAVPNYTFESIAWLSFAVMTMDPIALIFWIAGTYQMMVWAKQKHNRYKKEFGDKYPQLWTMFPGLF